jgi:hypothetical protein
MFCFLNSFGVKPVCFLKALLKTDFDEKPESYIISEMVFLCP